MTMWYSDIYCCWTCGYKKRVYGKRISNDKGMTYPIILSVGKNCDCMGAGWNENFTDVPEGCLLVFEEKAL
jgi:hypothetical protein